MGHNMSRLQSSPCSLSQPVKDAGAREVTGVRCVAARDSSLPFSSPARPHISHQSPPTRHSLVGREKGTALQSITRGKNSVHNLWYGPHTRLVRGMYTYTVQMSHLTNSCSNTHCYISLDICTFRFQLGVLFQHCTDSLEGKKQLQKFG